MSNRDSEHNVVSIKYIYAIHGFFLLRGVGLFSEIFVKSGSYARAHVSPREHARFCVYVHNVHRVKMCVLCTYFTVIACKYNL